MNRRKEIINDYKERRSLGGIYKITNTQNGKYLLGHAADLKSVQNRFEFSLSVNSAIHPKLQKDWAALGGKVFTLEILEELDQGPDQSSTDFLEDLVILEKLWQAKFDVAKAY